jgi:hypothetical protein
MVTVRPFGHTDTPRFQYVLQIYRNERPIVLLRETACIDGSGWPVAGW